VSLRDLLLRELDRLVFLVLSLDAMGGSDRPGTTFKVSLLGVEAAVFCWIPPPGSGKEKEFSVYFNHGQSRKFTEPGPALDCVRDVILPSMESAIRDTLSDASRRGLDVVTLAKEAVAQDVLTA